MQNNDGNQSAAGEEGACNAQEASTGEINVNATDEDDINDDGEDGDDDEDPFLDFSKTRVTMEMFKLLPIPLLLPVSIIQMAVTDMLMAISLLVGASLLICLLLVGLVGCVYRESNERECAKNNTMLTIIKGNVLFSVSFCE